MREMRGPPVKVRSNRKSYEAGTAARLWAESEETVPYLKNDSESSAALGEVATFKRVDIDTEAAEMLRKLNDPEGTEADVFWMFDSVMNLGIKELYRGRDAVDEVDPLGQPRFLSY